MAKSPDLGSAYALETPDDNRALYKDWAATYDTEFMDASGYILHAQVAHAFHDAGGRGPTLDIGAGTGGVGQVLSALGHNDIHATDISPEMLHIARSKSVYTNLFPGNILEGLPTPDGAYAGITSAGTFTLGHVGPEALNEVVRLLAPGGLAVLSIRDTHFEQADFATKISALAPHLQHQTKISTPIYKDNPDATHANDKAILLHLTKA